MPSGMKGSRFYERYDETDLLNLVQTHGFKVEDNVRQVSTKSTEGPQVKSWMNLIAVAPDKKDLLEIPPAISDTSASSVGEKKRPRKRVGRAHHKA